MEISTYQNNINFTSRNATIRFADDMMRRVNNEYPRVSSTKFMRMKNSDKFSEHIHSNIGFKIYVMRMEMKRAIMQSISTLKHWKIISDTVKKQKLGNCGEATVLTEIAAKVNGLGECYTAGIKPLSSKKPINHSFLYVDAKKPYIIDPWLEFADYVPNALKRYEAEYCEPGEKLMCYKQMSNHKLGLFDRLELEFMFPNLMIEKSPKVK